MTKVKFYFLLENRNTLMWAMQILD